MNIYTEQKPKFSVSFLGWEWSNSDGFLINQEYGVHIGIIGVTGYMKTNDYGGFFSTWPNARQEFYEKTGVPLWSK